MTTGNKISFIIPVYNAAPFLPRLLESLQAQDGDGDWEALFTDDGSHDESLRVLREAADQDARIRVFEISHEGSSGARNKGLDNATGDIIAFIDADDNLRKRLLSAFSRLIEQFCAYAVRFYDPQNLLIQKCSDDDFALRIVDFEPATRTFLPVDSMLPSFVRMKTLRRARRWLKMQLGVDANKVLPRKLRAKWDALIVSEGAAMGLSDCRVFPENKLVNDIFYEGLYKGKPCIVKCSSRAPDSIRNEYEILKRLWAIDKDVFPEPYDMHSGDMAFVVMEKIVPGKSVAPANDILRIAKALERAGIVHRDVSLDNLLPGTDGFLKLIDFQFAVDRNDYRETGFMRRRHTYLHVTFGTSRMRLGVWNDLAGAGLISCLQVLDADKKDVLQELLKMEERMTFDARVPKTVVRRLWWHEKSIAFRRLFNGKDSLSRRHAKVKALLSS